MSLKDLIAAAFNKDATAFESAFSSVMQAKVASAIDSRFLAREEFDLEESKEDDEDEDEEDDDSEEDDEDEKGMKEEVEQIDEISGAKLGSYMVKSRKSQEDAETKDNESYDDPARDNKEYRRAQRRVIRKRQWGQGKAMDKLTGSSFAKVSAGEK